MQVQNLMVLVEACAVRKAEATPKGDGWAVWIVHATRQGERREPLERQRGGVRKFATLDAVANALDAAGIDEFCVNLRSGEGSSDGR
ncbi:MAG: hypothetical protein U1F59_00890 [Candidatus Competibacteraceae bacterium]